MAIKIPIPRSCIAANIQSFEFQPGTYAEAEITPFAGLRIVPGVRLDWFNDINAGIIQPRVSFRWELPSAFALRGGAGLNAQPPQYQAATGAPNTLFPGQTNGNPHLLPQQAMHYDLGIERRFTGIQAAPWLANLSLSVEGFYKVLTDLVVQTPTTQYYQVPAPPPYTSGGTGHVMGLEVLLRYRASEHFFGWIAYTLSRSTRSDGPGLPEHLYDYDQTHVLTILGTYTLGLGFSVGLRFRYVTGNLFTPVMGGFYDADTSTYAPVNGPVNSQRLPDFNQLDIRIDKTFRFHWGSVGVFLEVLNVYNQVNPEGYQYNYNFTSRAPVNGIPCFPNLGIRGEI